MQAGQSPTVIFRVFSEVQSVTEVILCSALSKKKANPPNPRGISSLAFMPGTGTSQKGELQWTPLFQRGAGVI